MSMSRDELAGHLRAAFPNADIELIDLAGDDDHWKAVITDASFAGQTRVKQHQAVYAALKGRIGDHALHALALETRPK